MSKRIKVGTTLVATGLCMGTMGVQAQTNPASPGGQITVAQLPKPAAASPSTTSAPPPNRPPRIPPSRS